ncbi:HAMP domain-containing sensor histidine kinase [Paenibacillus gansuensis]|uniref:histidine kinase n=1 Tax=Paenibacillus gansuensis TaxID=306542 RepID=A0ABW5PFR5_9BACL
MTIRRKLFLAMAFFILSMGAAFVFVTLFVVKATLEHIRVADRTYEIEILSRSFEEYYRQSGGSWEQVQASPIVTNGQGSIPANASYLLLSEDQKLLYLRGTADTEQIKVMGIRAPVRMKEETIAYLYYLDPEVANLSKIQLGIGSSVTTLLLASSLVFCLLSLLIAYWLSSRLTRPIRMLVPAIMQLGEGKFGVKAPVTTKDEYAQVATAFNQMSQQLLRAEDVRRNLTADVAHELRTPITILRGKLDLIQQSGRSVEPESLLPLQDELIRLSRLVDDLHQLSLAEAKKLQLELKPTRLPALLQRIINRVSPEADRKGVRLELKAPVDCPEILVDPNRMTQVFLNLIVNAVHYTPARGLVGIVVRIGDSAAADIPRYLNITITDTGPGIGAEHLPHIFNRFYRTDEARTRNKGGMGLGLAIAKEFVSAHNGIIDVESSPGQGTSFIVTLPFNIP